MSRPDAGSIVKLALALIGLVVVLGSTGGANVATAASDPQGLEVTFSGGAFEGTPEGDSPPAMKIRGLQAGSATSGTVTVRNPGPGSRWFWLSQAGIAERLGEPGGRLSDSLQLTVLDVTRVDSPASVYRGPATSLGARPLGFLAPGAARTYSFTADLPAARLPGGAGARDPYRGASADITYAWHAIAGVPAPAPVRLDQRQATKPREGKPKPKAATGQRKGTASSKDTASRKDTTPPRLDFAARPRQAVLRTATLAVGARCNEACRMTASALVIGSDARWTAGVTGSEGLRRSRTLQVQLGPKALATVRRALLAGRVARIRVVAQIRDKAGNRGQGRYTLRLLPRS